MFRRVLALIKKEFLAIWKDPRSRAIIIAPPLIQLLLFANALTMEIKNIDMVVLDRSNTVESRELISRFENSRWFRNIIYANNEIDIRTHINEQNVQIGLEINNDFAGQIKQNKPVSVQVIVDGRQTNSAAIAGGYASQIISQYSNEIDKRPQGASIRAEVRNWFNPNLEYQWFLLGTLVSLLAVITALMLTALSIAREREMGTFDQLIVSPLSSGEILIGKTIPPLIIAVIMTSIMTVLAMLFFNMPFAGSVFWFFVTIIIALLSIVGIGLFISSLCKTQQQAILGVFVFQSPAILLSGFISPIEDMPLLVQKITYLNPIRFFMTITKGILFKGMLPQDIIMNLIPMIIMACVALTAAGWMFKRKLD